MQTRLLNKECLITYVVAIIAIVIFFWVIYPNLPFGKAPEPSTAVIAEEMEKFDGVPDMEYDTIPEAVANGNGGGEVEQADGASQDSQGGNMVQDPPYVDPKAGAIMDGPGFEKGEIDDIYQEAPNGIPSNYYFLDDGADGEMSIQHNLCSKSCCSEQWPKVAG